MDFKASITHAAHIEGEKQEVTEKVERRRSVDGTALETKYAGKSHRSILLS